MNKKLIASAVILSLSSIAFAAPSADAPAPDCDGLTIATGSKGKGYNALYNDIEKVCGSKVKICEVRTSGGLDNLTRLSTKDADIGFAQIDTWGDMKTSDDNIAGLKQVIPLNNNYLHIITSTSGFTAKKANKILGKLGFDDDKVTSINRMSDLRGKPVIVVGTAALLVRRIDQQQKLGLLFKDVKTDKEGIDLLRTGQYAAVFSVSGWPMPDLKDLSPDSGLTLVPFDLPISEPYKVKGLNYKSLAVYNINSLAVPNVMFTRPFTGQRAANVAALQSCIVSNMSELKEGKYQPGWNEINLSTEFSGLAKFKK